MDTKEVLGQESSWTDIDIAQTLANHRDQPREIVALINDFETNWFADRKSKAATHDRAIKACQIAANRLYSGCHT